ncbi:MAG: hypothetical protein IPG93_10245 [Burkholderiales bacterium]|nr:hypothetical protein [Burkholderiales bacterium]
MNNSTYSGIRRVAVSAILFALPILMTACGGGKESSENAEALTTIPSSNTPKTGIEGLSLTGVGSENANDSASGNINYALLGTNAEYKINITFVPSMGLPTVRLLTVHPSTSLKKINGTWSLVVNTDSVSTPIDIAYALAVKAERASNEQVYAGVIKVIAPASTTIGRVTTDGASVRALDGSGLAISATNLIGPLEIKASRFNLPSGSSVIKIEFGRDISSGNELINISGLEGLATPASMTERRRPLAEKTSFKPNYASFSMLGRHRLQKTTSLTKEERELLACSGSTTEALINPTALCLVSEVSSELVNDTASGGEPVIFIHGFNKEEKVGGGSSTWGDFKTIVGQTPSRNGKSFDVYEFKWRTNQRFQDSAVELKRYIETIQALRPEFSRVHIIAHSFGGILARTLIQLQGKMDGLDWQVVNDHVGSVLTLGSPHSGIFSQATTITLGNKSIRFPQGFDNYYMGKLAALCSQISCYQMGDAGSVYMGRTAIQRTAAKALYGLEENPGDFIAAISDWSRAGAMIPGGIPITVGIGLKTITVDGVQLLLENGDGLISFDGQRTNPVLKGQRQRTHCGSGVSELVGSVPLLAEVLINDGGFGFPYALVPPTFPAYKHVGGDGLLTVGTAFGFGQGEAFVECSNATSCSHGSWKLFKRHVDGLCPGSSAAMQGSTVKTFTCSTAKVGSPLLCTLSGNNIPEIGLTMTGAGCNAAVVTTSAGGTFVNREISGCTPSIQGLQQVSIAYGGSTLSSTTLTIQAASTTPTASAPSIVKQPVSIDVTAGQNATFTIEVVSSSPVTYQWRLAGIDIPGANNAQYTLPVVTSADSGSVYSVKVSNASGSVSSGDAVLRVAASGCNGQTQVLPNQCPSTSSMVVPTQTYPTGGTLIHTVYPGPFRITGGSGFRAMQAKLYKAPFSLQDLVFESVQYPSPDVFRIDGFSRPSGLALEWGTTYRWEVSACTDFVEPRACLTSIDGLFSTASATATPVVPESTMPISGAVVDSLNPVLAWHTDGDGTTFPTSGGNFASLEVIILTAPFGSSDVVYRSGKFPIRNGVVPSPLTAGKNYQWKLIACNAVNSCITGGGGLFSIPSGTTKTN